MELDATKISAVKADGSSLLESFAGSSSSMKTFLYGPSQSGKTSLAMEVAHSIACEQHSGLSSFSSEKNNESSVIILRHTSTKGALFPMQCCSCSSTGIPPSACWNEEALERISVRYVDTYSALIQALSSIQIHFRNTHCLIIDDLDIFLPPRINDDDDKSSSIMILQTIALSTDTVNFLEQQHRQSAVLPVDYSVHLIITMNENNFPLISRSIILNWMTSILHLTAARSNSYNASASIPPFSKACHNYDAFWESSSVSNNKSRLQKASLLIRPVPELIALQDQNIHINLLEWRIF